MLTKPVIPTRAGLTMNSRKPSERQRAGRAGVVPGRHAGARGDRVGVDAPVGQLVEDVRVQVDEARRDDLPGRVDHARRPTRPGCRGRRPRSGRASIATSSRPSCPPPGSTTSPPRISRSNLMARPLRERGASDALTNPPVVPATSSSNTTAPSSSEQVRVGQAERVRLLGEQLDGAREVGVGVGERAADRLLAHDEVERRDRRLGVVHAEPERAAAGAQERDRRGARRVGADRVDDEVDAARPRRSASAVRLDDRVRERRRPRAALLARLADDDPPGAEEARDDARRASRSSRRRARRPFRAARAG